jgi:hypothetical protein
MGGTNLTRDFHAINETFPMDDFGNPQLNVLFFSRSHSLVLGPTMEVSLPRNLSVEVNALHRALRSTQIVTSLFSDGTRQSSTDQFVDADTWEYPVLLKYALPGSRLRPFVEAGPSFRTWKETQRVEPSHYGVTAGLGAEMNWGKLIFAPMIRYTRWASDGRFPLRSTNPDQVELLGSFSYSTVAGSRSLAGRKIWLGAVAGTAVTEGFLRGPNGFPLNQSRPFVGGLTVEVDLGKRLSVEVDGLYRPLHAEYQSPGSNVSVPFTVLTWQIPVLVKYRFTRSSFEPFFEGGPSLRLSGNTNGYLPSRYGATVGVGLQVAKVGQVSFAPAVRYTRWAKDDSLFGALSFSDPRTAANQVEIYSALGFEGG